VIRIPTGVNTPRCTDAKFVACYLVGRAHDESKTSLAADSPFIGITIKPYIRLHRIIRDVLREGWSDRCRVPIIIII